MYCLKCGCDIKSPNVFCDSCLEDMAACPVRSDAVINLPERPVPTADKKSRKKKITDTDRLRILRRWSVWLCTLILVLATVVCLLTYQLVLMQESLAKPKEPPKGQNFSTQETTTASESTAVPSAT